MLNLQNTGRFEGKVPIPTRLIMSSIITIILTSAISMFCVSWIYFKMLRIAHEKGLVDNPDARKLQKQPVPLVGGLCVFFGVIGATLIASCLMDCTDLVPILMAMSIMLFLGCIDDLIGLTPTLRFIIEVIIMIALIYGGGGCIDSLHGLWGIETFSWYIAVPLTVFAGVGVINAINMIDGVNGLCSGLCITCSCLFGYAFYRGSDYPNSMLCFAMAAGLCPFLLHNVVGKTSKMFIGDAGTMCMGALMTWCVMQVLRHDSHARWSEYQEQGMNVIAFTLAILSVPVFDTLRVMIMRILRGGSPFKADKTHLHHVIYQYGQSHSITALTEIILDLFVCISFAITFKTGQSVDMQLYVVVATGVIFVWGTYFLMTRGIRLNTNFAYFLRRVLQQSRQGEKSWWARLQKWIDTPRLDGKMD